MQISIERQGLLEAQTVVISGYKVSCSILTVTSSDKNGCCLLMTPHPFKSNSADDTIIRESRLTTNRNLSYKHARASSGLPAKSKTGSAMSRHTSLAFLAPPNGLRRTSKLCGRWLLCLMALLILIAHSLTVSILCHDTHKLTNECMHC